MNAFFRHLAFRLWGSALAGGLLALLVLPWFQGALDLPWLPLAVLFVLSGCFVAVGRLMNFAGLRFLQRQVQEAAVWEQANMVVEAQTAYNRALGQYDSFWLSPSQRKRQAPWLAGKLARFYLGRSTKTLEARAWVADYLNQFPQDEPLAELWLEQLPLYVTHTPEEQAAAALVGGALIRNRRIRQLLMKFYLGCGRIDFDALQTYRSVWKEGPALPEAEMRRLCRLLIEAAHLSHWALQVYIAAYRAGESAALAGIFAALRWLPPDTDNKEDIAVAGSLVGDQDQSTVAGQILQFKPAEFDARPKRRRRPSRGAYRPVVAAALKSALQRVSAVVSEGAAALGHGLTRPLLWCIVLVPVAAFLLWFAGRSFLARQPVEVPPPVQMPQPEVSPDPFTIQVAAYLKPNDARQFVDQLVDKGLDAFWTKAASADRTWYQVKVSHFASKEAARAYGRDLKSKGLIDDFYVANYDGVAAASP